MSIPGIVVLPILMCKALNSLHGHPWWSLLLIGFGPALAVIAISALRMAYTYHFKAWDRLHGKEVVCR